MNPIELLMWITYVVAISGFVFVIGALKLWVDTIRIAAKLVWVQNELERAVQQLESDDEDAVLAGLQLIGTYNAPEIRGRVFKKVEELLMVENKLIAQQAAITKSAIVQQAVLGKRRADRPYLVK